MFVSIFAGSIALVLVAVRMLDYPFEGALALRPTTFNDPAFRAEPVASARPRRLTGRVALSRTRTVQARLITAARTGLRRRPVADVFISYARATAEVAQLIARALRDEGYSVWIDDALPLHREFASVIEENLRAAKAVLVLWSAEARASRWVPAEADLAHERGTLVQLSLDGAPPPFPFNRLHCEIAAGWRGDTNAPAWRKVQAQHRRPGALDEGRRASVNGARLTTNRVVASERERLLAVLAFDNLSADAEMVDFCDGVSEEIQQTVAQGSGLKVVARSSSFQFRGADKAVDKVAAALRATHLLDGSVRRSGSRVRISAQLVECEGGSTLWASRFDGDLERRVRASGSHRARRSPRRSRSRCPPRPRSRRWRPTSTSCSSAPAA